MKMSYTYFVDLATSADQVQNINVSAGGKEAVRRLTPFFAAYKYYKLGPVSVKFVPASTLPVDPTGLSYTAGENTVDPRDQFNPGLIRITNGEDVLDIDDMDSYYALMLDRRWFKFQLQSGAARTCIPRVWSVGQLHQDRFPGAVTNYPTVGDIPAALSVDHVLNGTSVGQYSGDPASSNIGEYLDPGSDPRGLFQVGHNITLGWLPTDSSNRWTQAAGVPQYSGVNPVPEVPVLTIILPQAYKTKYYYRVFVTETIYFKDPVALNTPSISVPGNVLANNGIDRFVYSQLYDANDPTNNDRIWNYYNDGSDYRSDTGGA